MAGSTAASSWEFFKWNFYGLFSQEAFRLKIELFDTQNFVQNSELLIEGINQCDYEKLINDQINRELEASNYYYALQFKFGHQSNSRPNFYKMLASRADEERDHANMLAEFQLSRGYGVEIGQISKPSVEYVDTINEALLAMIELEEKLTKSKSYYRIITKLLL